MTNATAPIKKTAPLLTRVKSHCTSGASHNVAALSLLLETIEHSIAHEPSVLCHLIGKSQPANGRAMRSIVKVILDGVKIVANKKADSGLKIVFDKNKVDSKALNALKVLVQDGKSLVSKNVKDAFKIEPEEKPVTAIAPDALSKALNKSLNDKIGSGAINLADAIKAMEVSLKALRDAQALETKGKVNAPKVVEKAA